jgi:hypothetical protein
MCHEVFFRHISGTPIKNIILQIISFFAAAASRKYYPAGSGWIEPLPPPDKGGWSH